MRQVFAAVHESVVSTKRTSSDVRLESAFGGKADYTCSERVFRLLTHFGRRDLIGQRSIVSNFSLAALSQNARL
jgi:hypothetical protein